MGFLFVTCVLQDVSITLGIAVSDYGASVINAIFLICNIN